MWNSWSSSGIQRCTALSWAPATSQRPSGDHTSVSIPPPYAYSRCTRKSSASQTTTRPKLATAIAPPRGCQASAESVLGAYSKVWAGDPYGFSRRSLRPAAAASILGFGTWDLRFAAKGLHCRCSTQAPRPASASAVWWPVTASHSRIFPSCPPLARIVAGLAEAGPGSARSTSSGQAPPATAGANAMALVPSV